MKDRLKVIQEHSHVLPVRIDKIIAEIGLTLRQEEMAEHVSGYIAKKGDSYEIVVNSSHTENRKRFTAAHELCHYIYHRDLIGDYAGDNLEYRSRNTGRDNLSIQIVHERQANTFAANVLMPAHMLINVDHMRTEKLADMFAVSRSVMAIRLGRSTD
jgi:Zn-dependent peptidase ImmA (M78 family)